MATPTYNTPETLPNERKSFLAGYLFGVPVGDMGWFASLLMAVAAGMVAFFLATFLAIVTILFANAKGHHWDFAWSYLRAGVPVGLTVMVVGLAYMGMLWTKRILRKA
jgi:ABC-type dipeptide/oligopeptide/nickel transport system permease subunit